MTHEETIRAWKGNCKKYINPQIDEYFMPYRGGHIAFLCGLSHGYVTAHRQEKAMKHTLLTVALATTVFAFSAHPVQASNRGVEEAIAGRADLSIFYQALVNTGVINELRPDVKYTVFAPTNAAFNAVPSAQYPCFYSELCRADVADVLRNHIVPGEEYVDTVARQKGGVYSMDRRYIAIAEPHRNDYTVDSHDIISTSMIGAGVIYKINGVIADKYELSAFEALPLIPQPPMAEEKTTTVTTVDPSCDLPPCPDNVSRTTTITRTTTLSPAR